MWTRIQYRFPFLKKNLSFTFKPFLLFKVSGREKKVLLFATNLGKIWHKLMQNS